MKKNDIIKLNICDITLEGSGVGRYDGLAVFVPNTSVGDEIEAKILKVKSNYAFAKLEKILTPSNDRISDTCAVYSKCGGCVFRHIDYKAELKIKENVVKNNFLRIAGFMPEFEDITGLSQSRYRNKAQYPISVVNDKVVAGFYSPRSHRVNDCADCDLQPESFSGAVLALKQFIAENNISVYNEQTGKGLVRHLYIRRAKVTGETMVCLVINGDSLPYSDDFLNKMKSVFGPSLASVVLNINKKDTNVILGDQCKTIFGKGFITDFLCGVKVKISPLSFYQINHDVAELLYKKAAEFAEPKGKMILDLYCGAGTIGLSMAKDANRIIGVEVVLEAVKDAKENARNNDFTNCEFICADAAMAVKQLENKKMSPDVVILDPPRKGCDAELIKTVANGFNPEKIVYVSCDSATLARDCKLFAEQGYKTIKAAVFDMFPRAGHVETVCLLSKK